MNTMTTAPITRAARLCAELVTLLNCARAEVNNPDEFLREFNTENLLSCASSRADELYDLMLQGEMRARKAQQQSAEGAA